MKKVGPYEILETLRLGPRPLYSARATDGRLVALKTIPVAGISPEARERFTREAAICSNLDHPNLVRVLDTGEADGFLYLSMELLQGSDLHKVIADKWPLSWEQKLSIMEQICDGLEFAHSQNLVHRDIKPANVFIEKSGRARILDFGMARVDSSSLTRAGMAVGTMLYMAPEQIKGETCTAASDVFAAGIIFYELATGRHPFAGGQRGVSNILSATLYQDAPPLFDLAPDAPAGLDLVLEQALQKEPAKRPQRAGDLKKALGLCTLGVKLKPPLVTSQNKAASKEATVQDFAVGKTIVIRREEINFKPKPEPVPLPQPAPAPLPKLDAIFCPACTYQNFKAASQCANCGIPLAAPGMVETKPAPRTDWMTVLSVVLILLALVLIVALVVQR